MAGRYSFNKGILKRLGGFGEWLEELGNSPNTIRQKLNYAGFYLQWVESENLTETGARYNDLLSFITHCRKHGCSNRHINRKLGSIRDYYNCLKENGLCTSNPAANLHLRGERKRLPPGILDFNDLEKLYSNYDTGTLRGKRNKAIFGLLAYQGLATGELGRLRPDHLKLDEGKIYIQGNRKKSGRELKLEPCQILELESYLKETRPQILEDIEGHKPGRPACRPGRKPNEINEVQLENQLFTSINGSTSIKSSLLHMFKGLHRLNPSILNPKQIRASAITHWLKSRNLRQAQYMAGHSCISSTERYKLADLEGLMNKLDKYHPLK